jgi:PIN domain nuclease of toxin-antitoxin system
VNLLLDTHVVLWWRANDARLGSDARAAIRDAAVVWVSSASAWEVAIKTALGRLRLAASFAEGVAASGFDRLAITFDHAEAVASLPRHHADPFDRMLVAQARVERMTLVTADRAFAGYDVRCLWA